MTQMSVRMPRVRATSDDHPDLNESGACGSAASSACSRTTPLRSTTLSFPDGTTGSSETRSARGRRTLQPWLTVPLMYLGLMFVAPPYRSDGRGCRLGAGALRLRAFLGVGHRASGTPLVSGDGHRKRDRLPGGPCPVSARRSCSRFARLAVTFATSRKLGVPSLR